MVNIKKVKSAFTKLTQLVVSVQSTLPVSPCFHPQPESPSELPLESVELPLLSVELPLLSVELPLASTIYIL